MTISNVQATASAWYPELRVHVGHDAALHA